MTRTPFHADPDFPGKINLVAINGADRVIQSAFVRKNETEKFARVELGYYRGTTAEQHVEARQAALVAVLAYLGEEWGGVVVEVNA